MSPPTPGMFLSLRPQPLLRSLMHAQGASPWCLEVRPLLPLPWSPIIPWGHSMLVGCSEWAAGVTLGIPSLVCLSRWCWGLSVPRCSLFRWRGACPPKGYWVMLPSSVLRKRRLFHWPLPHPLAVISQGSSMTLSWVSVSLHLRVASGSREPIPGAAAGVGEVTDTSQGCGKVPGAPSEPEQSELTRDPGGHREEAGGRGARARSNLEPRLEAQLRATPHARLYGLCPKVSLEVMGRKLVSLLRTSPLDP